MTCKIKINHPLYFYILFQLLEAEVAISATFHHDWCRKSLTYIIMPLLRQDAHSGFEINIYIYIYKFAINNDSLQEINI